MDSESQRTSKPTPPNKVQMLVFGLIAAATLLRLQSQDSGPLLWINIVLLVVGLAGFAAAALKPSLVGRKQ